MKEEFIYHRAEDYMLIMTNGGEDVSVNLLKGHSSAKPEVHESLAYG